MICACANVFFLCIALGLATIRKEAQIYVNFNFVTSGKKNSTVQPKKCL